MTFRKLSWASALAFLSIMGSWAVPASAQDQGCKREVITSAGAAKFRPFTKAKELRGDGASMAAAIENWQRDVITKYGEQWMQWENAVKVHMRGLDKHWNCTPARVGTLGANTIRCTVSGRPCLKGGREEEEETRGPILLGERTVDFENERDRIVVGRDEDWFRNRAFRALRFEVERNDIFMRRVELVYLNGHEHRVNIDKRIADGRDLTISLRGEHRYVKEIVMYYRSIRPNYRGKALVRVFGERSERDRDGDRDRRR